MAPSSQLKIGDFCATRMIFDFDRIERSTDPVHVDLKLPDPPTTIDEAAMATFYRTQRRKFYGGVAAGVTGLSAAMILLLTEIWADRPSTPLFVALALIGSLAIPTSMNLIADARDPALKSRALRQATVSGDEPARLEHGAPPVKPRILRAPEIYEELTRRRRVAEEDLAELDRRWLDYQLDTGEYFLTRPLLHTPDDFAPAARMNRSWEAARAALAALPVDPEESQIDTLEARVTTARADFDHAWAEAGRLGAKTMDPAAGAALRRAKGYLAQIADLASTDHERAAATAMLRREVQALGAEHFPAQFIELQALPAKAARELLLAIEA